jgi:hypothetical protein
MALRALRGEREGSRPLVVLTSVFRQLRPYDAESLLVNRK